MVSYKFKFKKRNEDKVTVLIDDAGVMHMPETSFLQANTPSLIKSMIELLINENWTEIEVEEET